MANPLSVRSIRRVAGPLDDLERIARRRCAGIGNDDQIATGGMFEDVVLELLGEAGFLAIGEQRSHLNSGSADLERCGKALRRSCSTRHPEGKSEITHLLQVHVVTITVQRLPSFIEVRLTAWRRVMSPRCRSLHYESIHRPVGLPCQSRRERIRGDDREQTRTSRVDSGVGAMLSRDEREGSAITCG